MPNHPKISDLSRKRRIWVSNFWTIGSLLLAGCMALIGGGGGVNAQTKYSFDIKSLTGEPDYRSVNLTWEVEDYENEVQSDDEHQAVSNRNFIVYYCELQTWGAHRCKSKLLEDESNDGGQYSMTIDHLRMATKYSFHVKAQGQKDQKASRADLNGNILKDDDQIQGQTIIIPTKGFSAHATKCLPDVSEIEVETGPYFGGKIVAENKNCFIQGDPLDERDTYTMKIEHDKCGSQVNHEALSVETFITVQENLGILTHSTRRFMVVCTFQPDTLTVRARLALPGRGSSSRMSSEWWSESNGRSARERQFRMVNKTALVLKEDYAEVPDYIPDEIETEGFISEIAAADSDENLVIDPTEKKTKHERLLEEDFSASHKEHFRSFDHSGFEFTGLLLAICISVIMIGAFLFIIYRENHKIKRERMPNV